MLQGFRKPEKHSLSQKSLGKRLYSTVAIGLMELQERVQMLNFAEQDYVLFGSAPLLAHKLILSINDIDILARHTAWQKAQQLGTLQTASAEDKYIRLGNDIDIYNGWMGQNITTIFAKATLIGGLVYASLEDVLYYKLELNRDKDQEHIRLLQKALSKEKHP